MPGLTNDGIVSVSHPICWEPPSEGWVQLNTYASILKGDAGCGLRLLIRNHLDEVLYAQSIFLATLS